jgi:hypothetical protein
MITDSQKKKLNSMDIVTTFLQENPQPHPIDVMIPAIIAELSHPGVITKQIGNTLFEVIPGKDGVAFFKAFNADTGARFIENSKQFVVMAHRIMGIKKLVTQFTDPTIERLFAIIKLNPPMPGMGYTTQHLKDGQTRIILNLGD